MKNLRSIFQVFSMDLFSKAMMGLGAILLIRYMPQEEYGTYTMALSLATVLTQTMATCFNRIYILRFEHLRLEASQTPFLGLQLLIILTISVTGIPFRSLLEGAYGFAATLAMASILSDFSKTSFQRDLRFWRFSLVEITRSGLFLASVLGMVWFSKNGTRAWTALLAQAVAMFAAFALASFRNVQWCRLFQIGEAFRLGRRILSREYWLLYGYLFVLSVFSQIDVFMLKWLGSGQNLATFGAASRYYNLLLIPLGAIHTVLLPTLKAINTLPEWKALQKHLNRLLFLFIPVVLIGAWASEWIMPWIDHGKYPAAVTVFRILALSTIISFAFSPYVQLLIRFEDFKFLFTLICIASAIAVALHRILIPPFGPQGAALATLLSFGLVNLATFLRSRIHYRRFAPGPAHCPP